MRTISQRYQDHARGTIHGPEVTPCRKFVLHDAKVLVSDDPIYPDAFRHKPDFAVVDHSVHARAPPRTYWRHCSSFMEVKAHNKDCPIPPHAQRATTSSPAVSGASSGLLQPSPNISAKVRPPVKGSLAQAADYARGILTCRPFQLFVYGIIQWGIHFAVGIFDRHGIVLSPQYSLEDADGLETFIRVVLRITYESSEVDLGMDPTVVIDAADKDDPNCFPRFIVQNAPKPPHKPKRTDSLEPQSEDDPESEPEDDPRSPLRKADYTFWMTIGAVLWRSHALLGRGTSVWRAVDSEGRPVILKTSWRSPNRRSEREIYRAILDIFGDASALPRGMVQCGDVAGSDVFFPQQWGEKIDWLKMSVQAMRRLPSFASPSPAGDAILHRIAFYDFGKSLWEYTCPEQLIRAMETAIRGERHRLSTSHAVGLNDVLSARGTF